MNKRNALTLVELLVIIGILFFLLAIVIPALRHPRGPTRPVCMFNLRDLSIAWIIYADDNDGKIVNGQPSVNANGMLDTVDNRPTTGNRIEIPWAQGIEIDTSTGDPKISRQDQEKTIKDGALWPYIQGTKAYRCPDGKAKHMRTYSIVCSMNGDRSPVAGRSDARMLCVKNRSLVRKPHNRILYVCEGWVNNLSFRVGYNNPGKWIDPPPVRHSNGMNFVFADGHSGFWKWKGDETIKLGESAVPGQLRQHVEPQTIEGKEDLQKMQEAVWGKLSKE